MEVLTIPTIFQAIGMIHLFLRACAHKSARFSVMGHQAITLRQVVIIGKMITPMKTMITTMKRLLLHHPIIHGVELLSLQFGTTIITMMKIPTPMEISSIAVIMIKTMIMCTIKILGEKMDHKSLKLLFRILTTILEFRTYFVRIFLFV